MLSVLIPVYNELNTIAEVIRQIQAVDIDKEIILVDDFSKDGTREFLKENFAEGTEGLKMELSRNSDSCHPEKQRDEGSRRKEILPLHYIQGQNDKKMVFCNNLKIYYHNKNQGKGAAIRTALEHASGKYSIIQDADLEYNPQDYKVLLNKAEEKGVDVIYGSRFLKTWKTTPFWHFCVNKFLTMLTNILYGSKLTDMETCYKLIRTDLFKSLEIESNRFEIEPEITAKLLKRGYAILEVPVSYKGRSYHDGKKICWRDGVAAIMVLFEYRFKI